MKTMWILGLSALPFVPAVSLGVPAANPVDCGPCTPGCCESAVEVRVSEAPEVCPPGCCVQSEAPARAALPARPAPAQAAVPAPTPPAAAAPATTGGTSCCDVPCPPKCC